VDCAPFGGIHSGRDAGMARLSKRVLPGLR
jgi:hypothetical protein